MYFMEKVHMGNKWIIEMPDERAYEYYLSIFKRIRFHEIKKLLYIDYRQALDRLCIITDMHLSDFPEAQL